MIIKDASSTYTLAIGYLAIPLSARWLHSPRIGRPGSGRTVYPRAIFPPSIQRADQNFSRLIIIRAFQERERNIWFLFIYFVFFHTWKTKIRRGAHRDITIINFPLARKVKKAHWRKTKKITDKDARALSSFLLSLFSFRDRGKA